MKPQTQPEESPATVATGASKVHQLSPAEKSFLQVLNILVLNGKAAVFDIHGKLEATQKDLATAQVRLEAALAGIASANGMTTAQVSADFNSITGASA